MQEELLSLTPKSVGSNSGDQSALNQYKDQYKSNLISPIANRPRHRSCNFQHHSRKNHHPTSLAIICALLLGRLSVTALRVNGRGGTPPQRAAVLPLPSQRPWWPDDKILTKSSAFTASTIPSAGSSVIGSAFPLLGRHKQVHFLGRKKRPMRWPASPWKY